MRNVIRRNTSSSNYVNFSSAKEGFLSMTESVITGDGQMGWRNQRRSENDQGDNNDYNDDRERGNNRKDRMSFTYRVKVRKGGNYETRDIEVRLQNGTVYTQSEGWGGNRNRPESDTRLSISYPRNSQTFGTNDRVYIEGSCTEPRVFVQIFNRKNEQVFQSAGPVTRGQYRVRVFTLEPGIYRALVTARQSGRTSQVNFFIRQGFTQGQRPPLAGTAEIKVEQPRDNSAINGLLRVTGYSTYPKLRADVYDGGNNKVRSVDTTVRNGNFSFEFNLSPGTYRVEVVSWDGRTKDVKHVIVRR
ncbi:MAG: hypothetical protein JSS72_09705 [Armatimonadetes bacterium]|nr:hypothetical protein [Armatimonadota bacterium]